MSQVSAYITPLVLIPKSFAVSLFVVVDWYPEEVRFVFNREIEDLICTKSQVEEKARSEI